MIPFPLRAVSTGVAVLALSLAGCSTINETFSGDKVDYRGTATKSTTLEVPPDLTQLSADSRYLPPSSGVVSANTYQAAGSAPGTGSNPGASAAQTVSPSAVGDIRLQREGTIRWLVTPYTPEQLWPKLEAFWQDRNLALTVNRPEAGVMETEWAENRSKLPVDIIRRTLGKALDMLYSTGELDRFRVRVERMATGSEVYITHSGQQEVYTSSNKDTTGWQPRPREPQLEAQMLSLLMLKLGAKEEQAKAAITAPEPAAAPSRARPVAGAGVYALTVDDAFDRAWRRVGLALDRSGFTVEDRDRGQGVYFVRYVDPASAGKEERGFFAKLFNRGEKTDKSLSRYQVSIKSEGDVSTVTVLDDSGAPERGEAGKRIVDLLVSELK